ncbi:MAG: hypothetical protein JSW49_02690 [candidate division WOR-3 bacterium]|nr:MAG: hypothetical protein JSW49_02690 [candidate division WOR-3 bacterium]
MKSIITMRLRTAGLIYIACDLMFVILGMGVPILCIILGFIVGWFVVIRLWEEHGHADLQGLMRRTLKYSILSVLVTFAVMLVIWGRMFVLLFHTSTDYANLGIPLILYDPKLSFVGWLILMIFISPGLQLLTTIFAACVTIQRKLKCRGVN